MEVGKPVEKAVNPACWVVTRIRDGAMIGQYFHPRTFAQLSTAVYRIETAEQYLCRIGARSQSPTSNRNG